MANKTAVWPGSYRAIQAWGIMLGSFEPYIRGEQMRAFKEGAPLDAVYKKGEGEDGEWVRLRNCHKNTVSQMKHIMEWMR